VSKLLPVSKQRFSQLVTGLNVEKKVATFEDGSQIQYKALVSTLPLDVLLQWVNKGDWADELQHSSSHIIGIGIRGSCPHGSKCWLYFPEADCPFYRYCCLACICSVTACVPFAVCAS
jgi:protoporphyrinogen oxidase